MADADQDKPEEIEARMLGGLKRALATKPEPHKPIGKHPKLTDVEPDNRHT
jgi:hypothetical protein